MVRGSHNYLFIGNQLPFIRKMIKYGFSDIDIANELGLTIDMYLGYLKMHNTNVSNYKNGYNEEAKGI